MWPWSSFPDGPKGGVVHPRAGVRVHPTRVSRSSLGNDPRVIIETRQAGPQDLKRASEVLGEAFADYPWTKWTVDPDDHQARITRLQLLALENLGLPFGEVRLSSLEGTIQSVAVWMDSAVRVPSSVYRSMDPVVAQLEGCRHNASLAAEREIAQWRPDQRHFTLAVLGTAPASQRKGLGTRTLAPGLSTADQQGAGSFLETSSASNLAFYATLGFEVVGHKRLEGDGPDVWAMYREHRPIGSRPSGT
jgi:GNAT superfamily N-acetyltransferase